MIGFLVIVCIFLSMWFFKVKKNKSLFKSILYGFFVGVFISCAIGMLCFGIRYAALSDEEKQEMFVKDSLERVKSDSLENIKQRKYRAAHKGTNIVSAGIGFLKKNLNDPESYEEVEANYSSLDSITCLYNVYIKYRAKNAFNAMILSEQNVIVYYDEKEQQAYAMGFHK